MNHNLTLGIVAILTAMTHCSGLRYTTTNFGIQTSQPQPQQQSKS
jgi:hypothetical protein